MIIYEEYPEQKQGIQSISTAIKNEGWEVAYSNNYNEFNFSQEQSRAAAFILRMTCHQIPIIEFINGIRSRNRDVLIYIYIDSP